MKHRFIEAKEVVEEKSAAKTQPPVQETAIEESVKTALGQELVDASIVEDALPAHEKATTKEETGDTVVRTTWESVCRKTREKGTKIVLSSVFEEGNTKATTTREDTSLVFVLFCFVFV